MNIFYGNTAYVVVNRVEVDMVITIDIRIMYALLVASQCLWVQDEILNVQ